LFSVSDYLFLMPGDAQSWSRPSSSDVVAALVVSSVALHDVKCGKIPSNTEWFIPTTSKPAACCLAGVHGQHWEPCSPSLAPF